MSPMEGYRESVRLTKAALSHTDWGKVAGEPKIIELCINPESGIFLLGKANRLRGLCADTVFG